MGMIVLTALMLVGIHVWAFPSLVVSMLLFGVEVGSDKVVALALLPHPVGAAAGFVVTGALSFTTGALAFGNHDTLIGSTILLVTMTRSIASAESA